jgi:tRNA(Ile)-lysidine synthetase-like protein
MTTEIETFWRSNPDYWIAIKNKERIDKQIYDKFSNYDWTKETDLGKVIYLDQFTRHFSRIDGTPESYILACRNLACRIVKEMNLSLYSVDDLVWLLMPFKHVGDYTFIFDKINTLVHFSRQLVEFPLLSRFFNDTYRKAYTYEKISKDIRLVESYDEYDPSLICDYYPEKYNSADWHELKINPDKIKELVGYLKYVSRPCTVSLSGGVDSMVLCALLKLSKIPFNAIHIVYGNREESLQELAFISRFCSRLEIPLYTYRIEHLKRGNVDREFYEEMTREIRFSCYRVLTSATADVKHLHVKMVMSSDNRWLSKPVLLGHIQEDVVENIWTNFAKGQHLDKLGKMEIESVENGVRIIRPFLEVNKTTIYSLSEELGIPYLKNTTPSWSNRGKFREKFYAATHEQYGKSVDKKVIEVAERLSSQANLINKLLYEPIYKSWCNETKTIDVSLACKASLDAEGWSQILTHICHEFLSISKPTIHACRNFTGRIQKISTVSGTYRYDLKKDLHVQITVTDSVTIRII